MQCIDRIVYRSIPRCILQAKGEKFNDEWEDIILEEYLDLDSRLVDHLIQ